MLTRAAIAWRLRFRIAVAGPGGRRTSAVLHMQHDVDGICKEQRETKQQPF